MSSKVTVDSIKNNITKLREEFEERKRQATASVTNRLEAIEKQREDLDREEAQILELLGKGSAKHQKKGTRRSTRMMSSQKRAVIERFIREGHIKDGTMFTRELRAALSDEGFNAPDFAALEKLVPSGWEVKKNGLRGVGAQTVFKKI